MREEKPKRVNWKMKRYTHSEALLLLSKLPTSVQKLSEMLQDGMLR